MIVPLPNVVFYQELSKQQIIDSLKSKLRYGNDYQIAIERARDLVSLEPGNPEWHSLLALAYMGRACSLSLVAKQSIYLEKDKLKYLNILKEREEGYLNPESLWFGQPNPLPPFLRTWDDNLPWGKSIDEANEKSLQLRMQSRKSIAKAIELNNSKEDYFLIISFWIEYFDIVQKVKYSDSDIEKLIGNCNILSEKINEKNMENAIDYCESVYRVLDNKYNKKLLYSSKDERIWSRIFDFISSGENISLNDLYQYFNTLSRMSNFEKFRKTYNFTNLDRYIQKISQSNINNARAYFVNLCIYEKIGFTKENNSYTKDKLIESMRAIENCDRNSDLTETISGLPELNGFSRFKAIGINVKSLPKADEKWTRLLDSGMFENDEKINILESLYGLYSCNRSLKSSMSIINVSDDSYFSSKLSSYLGISFLTEENDPKMKRWVKSVGEYQRKLKDYNKWLEKSRLSPYFTSYVW